MPEGDTILQMPRARHFIAPSPAKPSPASKVFSPNSNASKLTLLLPVALSKKS